MIERNLVGVKVENLEYLLKIIEEVRDEVEYNLGQNGIWTALDNDFDEIIEIVQNMIDGKFGIRAV